MDVHSERTGMSGVLTNSEFAVRKLTFSRCHGRHLLNSGTDVRFSTAEGIGGACEARSEVSGERTEEWSREAEPRKARFLRC